MVEKTVFEAFADNLHYVLQSQEITYKNIAARAGTTAANISYLVNGRSKSLVSMEAVSKALDIPVHRMLDPDFMRAYKEKGAA